MHDWNTKFTRYLLDDGSGTIRCMSWKDNSGKEKGCDQIRLGDFVEVRGRLEWRNKMPIVVVQWQQANEDPHAELIWWLDLKQKHRNCYSQNFTCSISDKAAVSASQQHFSYEG